MTPTNLKYGKKDGITGIRKHRFAKMPLREPKMTAFEIDDMLQRIANRRIDPLHYFPANYVPAVTVYFKEEMIGGKSRLKTRSTVTLKLILTLKNGSALFPKILTAK